MKISDEQATMVKDAAEIVYIHIKKNPLPPEISLSLGILVGFALNCVKQAQENNYGQED